MSIRSRISRILHPARRRLRSSPAATAEPELGYIFVITYGRSGSTLLQGILNSIPGYLVRGENRQVMRHLWAFHRRAAREATRRRRGRERRGLAPLEPTAAFFGIDEFPVRRSLEGIRRLALETLLRPEPDTRVVGFKEIRWRGKDLAAYVKWLRNVFPGARFVVNTRNLDAVSKSAWWGADPGARQTLEQTEARLIELRQSLGDAAFHVCYDDYVDDPSRLRPFFEWLGEEYDEQRIRTVLDTRHSY